jgi:hypothetical protein
MEDILKLSVEDRILLYGLQPAKGPYELLASFRLLEPKIKFTEKETREYDIKQVPQVDPITGEDRMAVAFNKEVAGDYTIDVQIPARMSSYISNLLEELDTKEELTFQYVSLYERFCLGKTGPTLPIDKVGKTNANINKQGKSTNK